jgi:hypothetical protein
MLLDNKTLSPALFVLPSFASKQHHHIFIDKLPIKPHYPSRIPPLQTLTSPIPSSMRHYWHIAAPSGSYEYFNHLVPNVYIPHLSCNVAKISFGTWLTILLTHNGQLGNWFHRLISCLTVVHGSVFYRTLQWLVQQGKCVRFLRGLRIAIMGRNLKGGGLGLGLILCLVH